MTTLFRPAIVLLLILTVLTGIAYPLLVTGIAQVAFPTQAGGSLLMRDGKAVGSSLIGQSFSDPKHFWSRPSATSPQPYNGAGLRRLEPRAAQPGADRWHQVPHRGPEGRRPRPTRRPSRSTW